MKTLEFKGKVYNIVLCNKLHPLSGSVCGLDIETLKVTLPNSSVPNQQAGLDPHQSQIRLIQIFDVDTVYIYDSYNFDLRLLKPLLEDQSKKFIAHFARFELKHLRKLGITDINIHDTLLMAQLLNCAVSDQWEPDEHFEDTPNEEKSGLTKYKRPGISLKALVEQYLGVELSKDEQVSDWNVHELTDEQIKYAALDAVVVVLLTQKLLPYVKTLKMMDVYDIQRKALISVCEMEYLGVKIDWDLHSHLIKDWQEKLILAESETKKYFGEINLGSPKQLGIWLEENRPHLLSEWPRTEKGALTFTATALADFRNLPEIKSLFTWKKYQKLLSTYGDSLREKHKNPVTQKIHTQFTVGQTNTGRMSSNTPNLQNIPSKGDGAEMRKIFIPENGYFVVADFSQIELQIQGELSGDTEMLSAFETGVDIYKTFACRLFHVKFEEVTKTQRTLAKVALLSLGYGTGSKKLRSTARSVYDLEMTESDAWDIYNGYYKTFHRYIAWCEKVRFEAKQLGHVTTMRGKRRYIPQDKIYTTAPNTIVQGTCAELMLELLNNLKPLLPLKTVFSLCVHDEIVIDTSFPETTKKVVEEIAHQTYLSFFPDSKTHKVLKAEIGSNWGDAKN